MLRTSNRHVTVCAKCMVCLCLCLCLCLCMCLSLWRWWSSNALNFKAAHISL